MKPHDFLNDLGPDLHNEAVTRTLQSLSPVDRDGLGYAVVTRAAEFFKFCPNDFCVQHANWAEGHAVFGGSNRLLWSVSAGFRPDPTYCSARFKEQFQGEFFEKIGELDCEGQEVCLVSSHHLNLDAGEVLPRVRIPLAWAGTLSIQGRRSIKGDGKTAEVRFFTGAEA